MKECMTRTVVNAKLCTAEVPRASRCPCLLNKFQTFQAASQLCCQLRGQDTESFVEVPSNKLTVQQVCLSYKEVLQEWGQHTWPLIRS